MFSIFIIFLNILSFGFSFETDSQTTTKVAIWNPLAGKIDPIYKTQTLFHPDVINKLFQL